MQFRKRERLVRVEDNALKALRHEVFGDVKMDFTLFVAKGVRKVTTRRIASGELKRQGVCSVLLQFTTILSDVDT